MTEKFPYKKTMTDSFKDGGIICGVVGGGAMVIKYCSKRSHIKTDTESLVIGGLLIVSGVFVKDYLVYEKYISE